MSNNDTNTLMTTRNKAVADGSAYIDFNVVSQIADDLSIEMLPEMVDLFITESTKRLEQIEQLLENRDFVELGNQSHALKGSAATFGAIKLTPLAESLEQSCKQGKVEDAEILTKQVIDVGKKTLDAYLDRFSRND